MKAIRTTCAYCGVGCGISATVTGERKVVIAGDPEHPANRGKLCSKGTHLGETLGLEGRLLYPEIDGRRASWDKAIRLVARKFSDTIARHGPDSVAFYVSGQLLTEDYYVANKLMKGFIGSGNIDTNSRLCMSSAVAGHTRAFGEDVVPATYDDLDAADLIVLAERAGVSGDRASHAQAAVGVDIAAADEALHQLVGDIVVLGQQLARDVEGDAVRAVAADGVSELARDMADGLVPARPAAADLGMKQSAFEAERFAQVSSFRAKTAMVGRMLGVAGNLHGPRAGHPRGDPAADAAIGAGRADRLH